MPVNMMMMVKNFFGALRHTARTITVKKPDASAMLIPSMATKTTPRGGKSVKFFTKEVLNFTSSSALRRLMIVMVLLSSLGSITLSPKELAMYDETNKTIISIAKIIAGWGRKLPSFSKMSKSFRDVLRLIIFLLKTLTQDFLVIA